MFTDIVEEIDFSILSSLKDKLQDVHINWQNDFDYLEKMEDQAYYGIYDKESLIGAVSASQRGKISFIWVDHKYRNKRIGANLVSHIVKELKIEKLYINFPNNNKLHGFVRFFQFSKDIEQYEMYLTL